MSQIVSKTIIKFGFCFRSESPTFDQLFIFRGIKLKFGGGTNSETLISYFMLILSNKMNLTKIIGFCVIFY